MLTFIIGLLLVCVAPFIFIPAIIGFWIGGVIGGVIGAVAGLWINIIVMENV